MRGKNQHRAWSPDQIEALREAYLRPEVFDVEKLCMELNRSKAAIFCKADDLKLTSLRGQYVRTEKTKLKYSLLSKRKWENPEWREAALKRLPRFTKENHPRGFLGGHHSDEAKKAISMAHMGKKLPTSQVEKSMKTRMRKYGSLSPNHRMGSWKAEWVEIGGKRFFSRSAWETNYAHFLEWMKNNGHIADWDHEPKTFWFEKIKRGCRSYLPDFCVFHNGGGCEWHEVKGWMDDRSKTKLKRFKKYYPDETLVLRDGTWFRSVNIEYCSTIPGWKTIKRK